MSWIEPCTRPWSSCGVSAAIEPNTPEFHAGSNKVAIPNRRPMTSAVCTHPDNTAAAAYAAPHHTVTVETHRRRSR